MGALISVRQLLRAYDKDISLSYARLIGVGGAMGLGGIIYSLVKISKFLNEPLLLDDAVNASRLIVPNLISLDRNYDIVNGSAGAILGLLTLYNETLWPDALAKANHCGKHLIANRFGGENKPKAWLNKGNKPLTGFAHGAAGIAYALIKLYEVTREIQLLTTASEGIEYETSVFVPEMGNWPDFMQLEEMDEHHDVSFTVRWCNGAPGIGLGRLGGLNALSTPNILHDISAAVETTKNYSWSGLDHLCCGNFGRIDMLLYASQKLKDASLLKFVESKTYSLVRRANQAQTFRLFTELSEPVFNPSFFKGSSGIGYELLRIARPHIFPSVLLWD
jgi:lantibiotic modifying enzyme